MIVILGTSNTVGGQDEEHKNPKIMIHNLLAKKLNCDVLNLSVPGRGSELYLENYVYACSEYDPKLFIVEIFIDRTFCNFSFPTEDTQHIFLENDIEKIYNCNREKRFSWKDSEIDFRIADTRINRISDNKIHLKKFQNCTIQWNSIEKILEMYRTVSIYLDEDYLLGLRSTKNLLNLQSLSKLLKIPILFLAYGSPAIDYNKPFVSRLNKDEYLNLFHGLPSGMIEWAEYRLKGNHFSWDNDHLNRLADELTVDELLLPFIENYIKKYNIIL
jgi:hypothetical protein